MIDLPRPETKIMPTVSVVIPAYNTAPYIKETLDSVFAQTFTDYEVIVVNDGSSDTEELERVLTPYLERIVYLKKDNEGPASARNAGIRVARGRYIALLDSDDLWMPEYLSVQIEILERDPTIDVLYPDAMIFGVGERVGKRFMEVCPSEGPVSFESLVELRCQVFTSTTAQRDVLLRAGLFDPDPSITEDFEFWLRITKTGGRIAYHRQVLAWYRSRPGSQSSDPVVMLERGMNTLDKVAGKLNLSPTERDAVSRVRTRFSADIQLEKAKRALLASDFESALQHLQEANAYFHRTKLALVELLIRFAPHLLLRAYNVREKALVAAKPDPKPNLTFQRTL